MPVKPDIRILALGGLIGPVAFVGAWSLAGATATRYSPVDDAISDLAAVDTSTRVAMTVGFVLFGVGVIGFGFAFREVFEGRAWVAAVVTGGCTLGVAASPLGGWSGDAVHTTFAGLGYAAIAALPVLAAPALERTGRRREACVSILTGVTSAVCLVASTFGPVHGLWQRLGLTAGDVWIVVVALGIATGRRAGARTSPRPYARP